MANFSLTTGADTVVGGASDDTVYGTAATLNAGDSLTGGAGTDVLALVGSGTFRVDQLANFSGFERITLDNATFQFANLTLGSQPIEVDATGYLSIGINSPSNWNGSDIINGDASHSSYLSFSSFWSDVGGSYQELPIVYDLTSNTFSHVYNISAGENVTLLINNADTSGVQSFSSFGPNAKLATAGSTLDLSHTTVSGLAVTSTNGLGTTFTVGDLGTAFQIAGGTGQDTIVATGFAFTADQRNAIFATASVENIVDSSGTYHSANDTTDKIIIGDAGDNQLNGGPGSDTITGGPGNDTIDGGPGIDTAVYSGSPDNFHWQHNPDGSLTITDLRPGSPEGTDLLRNVEVLEFHSDAGAGGQAITSYAVGDTFSWSTETRTYDAHGQLSTVREKTDAGVTFYTDYNVDHANPWNAAVSTYDAQGRLGFVSIYNTITTNNPNALLVTTYDAVGDKPWLQAITGYDGQGRMSYVTFVNKDNSYVFTRYSYSGDTDYAIYNYDAQNHLVQSYIHHPNGTYDIIT
jgi:hypothetical protein